MSNELINWGKTKPEEGIFINLYRQGEDHAVFCRVQAAGFFRSVEGPHIGKSTIPTDTDRWCEVPAPPDWKLVLKRRRAQYVVDAIVEAKQRLQLLEAESKKLLGEVEALETCDAVYNRADFPHGCPICGKEH